LFPLKWFTLAAARASTRVSTGRKTKEVAKKSLLAFSDSEAEEPTTSQVSSNGLDPLEMRRGANLVRKSISNRLSSNPATTSSSSKTLPTSFTSTRVAPSRTSRIATSSPTELSESDDPEQAGGVLYIHKTRKAQASTPLRQSALANFSDSENDAAGGHEFLSRSNYRNTDSEDVSRLLNYRATRRSTQVARDDESSKGPSFTKTPSIVTQAKRSTSNSNLSDSYISKTNKVSIIIVAGILVFFTFIASVYLYNCYYSKSENADVVEIEREFNIKYSEMNFPDCSTFGSNDNDSLSKAYCSDSPAALRPILVIMKEMRSLVDEQFRQRYCSQDNTKPSDDIYEHDIGELKGRLERTIQTRVLKLVQFKENTPRPSDRALFASLFQDSLSLLSANAKWHLKPVGSGQTYSKLINEQLYPTGLDLSCWVKFALLEHWKVVVAFAFILIGIVWSFVQKWFKVSEKKYKEQVNELVAKCCAHLRKEVVAIPVLHIRDTFFGPNEREKSSVKRLWTDVVKYIQSNESRVKVAIDNIDGEDFRTWTWVGQVEGADSTSPIRASTRVNAASYDDKSMTAWNSTCTSTSAVPASSATVRSTRTPTNFCALTRFLKARIMTQTEVSEREKARIHNDILDRVASESDDGKTHGILHLRIEIRNPTGIVYIKCDSFDSATAAFKALNNWEYKNGQIVVKFLQEDRYYVRYPEAERAIMPLDFV
jgi:hypothetical protein